MIQSNTLTPAQRYVVSSIVVELINGLENISTEDNYAEQYMFMTKGIETIKSGLLSSTGITSVEDVAMIFKDVK